MEPLEERAWRLDSPFDEEAAMLAAEAWERGEDCRGETSLFIAVGATLIFFTDEETALG